MNHEVFQKMVKKGERVAIVCFKEGELIGFWNGQHYAILLDTIDLFKNVRDLEYELERAKIAVPHKYDKDIEVRVIPITAILKNAFASAKTNHP